VRVADRDVRPHSVLSAPQEHGANTCYFLRRVDAASKREICRENTVCYDVFFDVVRWLTAPKAELMESALAAASFNVLRISDDNSVLIPPSPTNVKFR
jgi:hypothetical protein